MGHELTHPCDGLTHKCDCCVQVEILLPEFWDPISGAHWGLHWGLGILVCGMVMGHWYMAKPGVHVLWCT